MTRPSISVRRGAGIARPSRSALLLPYRVTRRTRAIDQPKVHRPLYRSLLARHMTPRYGHALARVMTGFGRAAVRRDARSDARHVTAMKQPTVTCRSLTDTRFELCLQRRARQMPRSMAARACVDAAVAQVLAAGGGVHDAAELAQLAESGLPPVG